MKFKFRELGIELYNHQQSTTDTEPGVVEALGNRIQDRVSEWLNFQSEHLVGLNLTQFISTGTLILPVFPHLTVLYILIVNFEDESGNLSIRPFTADQFPVLRELTIYSYEENYSKIFAQARLTSVETLLIYPNTGVSFTPVWSEILPNLKTFDNFELTNPPEIVLKTEICILTHYPQLQHLSLSLPRIDNASENESINYWEILTGGAPRPLDTNTLLIGELNSGHAELEAIDENGDILKVPSLRNMRGILTLFLIQLFIFII